MTPHRTIATAILAVILAFELSVLATLVTFPYIFDQDPAALNDTVLVFLAPVSPVLVIGLAYAWLVRIATGRARNYVSWFDRFLQVLAEPLQEKIASIWGTSVFGVQGSRQIMSRSRLVLALNLFVSALVGFVPYRSGINPSQGLVGVDSPLYSDWINAMLAKPGPQALHYSFILGLEGSRPLLLILLYGVASTGLSPTTVVEYLPAILSPLLSVSTYAFVRYGHGSPKLAGLVTLLTPFSFYTTVGLWGGYYANWLALVFVYLFMTMLLMFSRRPTRRNYSITYFLAVGIFLTHAWTWVLTLTVSLVFAMTVWRETRNLIHLESIFGIIATGIILDIVKSAIFSTRSVVADIASKSPSSFVSLTYFWSKLVQAMLYTNGGLMADWLILGLAMLASFVLRFGDRFERLLLLWTAVPSLPFFIFDSYNQSRIIYDLPSPVLTALGIVFFVPMIRNRSLQGILIATMAVTIANYALAAVFNL